MSKKGKKCKIISNKSEYLKRFECSCKKRAAFEKAWEIRNFEIELYWKRATYFWAFIATTFIGYFALISGDTYSSSTSKPEEVFLVICLGFILSIAWFFSNLGSKQWQKNWEMHIDLLEDDFTGPLYKMSLHPRTFSVSKINEVVSLVVIALWLGLAVKYLIDQDLLNCNPSEMNYYIVSSIIVTIVAVLAFIIYARGAMCDAKNGRKKLARKVFERSGLLDDR